MPRKNRKHQQRGQETAENPIGQATRLRRQPVETTGGRSRPSAFQGVDTRPARVQLLLDAFLSGRSERTIHAYRQDLEDFRSFTQQQTLAAAAGRLLSHGHGQANALAAGYKSALMARQLSASTVNRRLATLRSLTKLARTFGLVTWTLEVESLPAQPYLDTRGPGRLAVKRMMAAVAKRTDPTALRDRAILRLLYDLAMRRGEVVALNLGDIDLGGGSVTIVGKGRTQKTTLSLPQPTQAALADWIAVRGEAPGPLFLNFDPVKKGDGRLSSTSLYRIVREMGQQVGIKVTPHGLRHTAITEACKAAAQKGIDLEEVLDFSRHTDIRVLTIYRDRERDVQGLLANLVADDV